jgi:hypothetical protein
LSPRRAEESSQKARFGGKGLNTVLRMAAPHPAHRGPLSKPPRTGSFSVNFTERAREADQPDDDEGRPPVHVGGDPAAEEDAERGADRNAEGEDGKRPRPPSGGK